jgi:hypothetical protein
MDGVCVKSPLSKTEWEGGTSTTTVLSKDRKQETTQGMVPLDEQAGVILETGPRVSEYCLKLIALPDQTTSDAHDMLFYYQTWFKYNGAFLGLIRNDHADFIEWVEQGS